MGILFSCRIVEAWTSSQWNFVSKIETSNASPKLQITKISYVTLVLLLSVFWSPVSQRKRKMICSLFCLYLYLSRQCVPIADSAILLSDCDLWTTNVLCAKTLRDDVECLCRLAKKTGSCCWIFLATHLGIIIGKNYLFFLISAAEHILAVPFVIDSTEFPRI